MPPVAKQPIDSRSFPPCAVKCFSESKTLECPVCCSSAERVTQSFLYHYTGCGGSYDLLKVNVKMFKTLNWVVHEDLVLYRATKIEFYSKGSLPDAGPRCWSRSLDIARKFKGNETEYAVYKTTLPAGSSQVLFDSRHPKVLTYQEEELVIVTGTTNVEIVD